MFWIFLACTVDHHIGEDYMQTETSVRYAPHNFQQNMIMMTKQLKYCGWKKSCTSCYRVYPIIYRVLYCPGGDDRISCINRSLGSQK